MGKTVCFYVSGHGLGHAARATQVMAALPQRTRILVKSMAPAEFIRRESGRELEIFPQQFDVGTVQKTNREIDWDQTFIQAQRIQVQCERHATKELRFLQAQRVDAVVIDSPAFPLRIAEAAGIPGVSITNFTWVEIFRKAAARYPGGQQLLRAYAEDYRKATLALRTPLDLAAHPFHQVTRIPLIARRGTSHRRQLLQVLGLSRKEKLVLLYFGNWPHEKWPLQGKQHAGITFLAFSRMPSNVCTISPGQWSFPDIVASVDAVLAKPGYGTAGECMANGTPLVFHPRPEFAEYTALRRDLLKWGGAVPISTEAFRAGRWVHNLEQAMQLTAARIDASGARVAAAKIVDLV